MQGVKGETANGQLGPVETTGEETRRRGNRGWNWTGMEWNVNVKYELKNGNRDRIVTVKRGREGQE